MQTISHAITEANEFYTYDTTVREVSQNMVEYLDGMRETGHSMNKFLAWDNLTPVYFFKRLGEGGMSASHNAARSLFLIAIELLFP